MRAASLRLLARAATKYEVSTNIGLKSVVLANVGLDRLDGVYPLDLTLAQNQVRGLSRFNSAKELFHVSPMEFGEVAGCLHDTIDDAKPCCVWPVGEKAEWDRSNPAALHKLGRLCALANVRCDGS